MSGSRWKGTRIAYIHHKRLMVQQSPPIDRVHVAAVASNVFDVIWRHLRRELHACFEVLYDGHHDGRDLSEAGDLCGLHADGSHRQADCCVLYIVDHRRLPRLDGIQRTASHQAREEVAAPLGVRWVLRSGKEVMRHRPFALALHGRFMNLASILDGVGLQPACY